MADLRENRPALVQLFAISWNFGWPVAAGVVIGHWIDGLLGSSPVAVLFFGLGAMAGGIWNMNRLGRRDLADIEEEEAEQQRQAHEVERGRSRQRGPGPEDQGDRGAGAGGEESG